MCVDSAQCQSGYPSRRTVCGEIFGPFHRKIGFNGKQFYSAVDVVTWPNLSVPQSFCKSQCIPVASGPFLRELPFGKVARPRPPKLAQISEECMILRLALCVGCLLRTSRTEGSVLLLRIGLTLVSDLSTKNFPQFGSDGRPSSPLSWQRDVCVWPRSISLEVASHPGHGTI